MQSTGKPSENTPLSNDSPQSTSLSEVMKHDDDVSSVYECYFIFLKLITSQGSWVSSPKDCVFPETIPEEVSSIEEERVVIFRLPTSSYSSYYTVNNYVIHF